MPSSLDMSYLNYAVPNEETFCHNSRCPFFINCEHDAFVVKTFVMNDGDIDIETRTRVRLLGGLSLCSKCFSEALDKASKHRTFRECN